MVDNMNRVIIHIKRLGPVRNQTIELAPVMLFTGESSLGKSYVNFLAYYVFNVFSTTRLDHFLTDHFPESWEKNNQFSFKLKVNEIVSWMKDDVTDFFRYLYHFDAFKCDVDFEFPNPDTEIMFTCKRQQHPRKENTFYSFETIVDGNTIVSLTMDEDPNRSISRRFRELLCYRMLGLEVRRTILLPPGRASLLTGDYNTIKGSSQLGLYDLFLSDNAWINSRALRNIKKEHVSGFFIKYVPNFIKGNLVFEKEGLYLHANDGTPIPIAAAASSIRELLPLLQWIMGGKIEKFSICLEEPEAHLHPEMQVGVADLLAACIQDNVAMQITTHSDYFMQRINQLIKYGIIKERDEDAYLELCKKTGHDAERYLKKDIIKTYYFTQNPDGTTITSLDIDYNGIPMSTFFRAVENLTEEDVRLNNVLDTLIGHD